MDINELITIIKNKLLNQINIESINIEDKSFLHKNQKGNQEGKYHLKLNIVSDELKSMSRIESNKKIYKILDKELKEIIHSIQMELWISKQAKRTTQRSAKIFHDREFDSEGIFFR